MKEPLSTTALRTAIFAHTSRMKELIDFLELTLDKDDEKEKRIKYIRLINVLSMNIAELHAILLDAINHPET